MYNTSNKRYLHWLFNPVCRSRNRICLFLGRALRIVSQLKQFNEVSLGTSRKLVSGNWIRGQGSMCRVSGEGRNAGQGVAGCINSRVVRGSICVILVGLCSC